MIDLVRVIYPHSWHHEWQSCCVMSSWGNSSSHMEILGCGLDKEKQMLSERQKKKYLIPTALIHQDLFPSYFPGIVLGTRNQEQIRCEHCTYIYSQGWRRVLEQNEPTQRTKPSSKAEAGWQASTLKSRFNFLVASERMALIKMINYLVNNFL